ncbi:MAG: 3-dehydroquinate synthase [Vicinamibacteria bacterium]|nr:3-dehydroquinate synthase [Vicinamibacteria bacterium]
MLSSPGMIEIPVELGQRRYPITIGHGCLELIGELLKDFKGRRIVLVAGRRVFKLHGQRLRRAMRRCGDCETIVIPDGERYKSRETLAKLHDAATYMRGVDWVPIPTTLLAMVDSSVGGKVGINHPLAKNLLGAFHQPRAVIIDPAFLATLPQREIQSGAYEILKCAIIGDRALFRSLKNAPYGLIDWDQVELDNAIASAVRIKADVVERDERESDLRRVLNLGHTLGHALESKTRYRRFTHGEAVGWGMIGASWIAAERGLLTTRAYEAIVALVNHLGPRPKISDLKTGELLAAVKRDKKARAGRVVFVLPSAIGKVVIEPSVDAADVRGALKAMALNERAFVE